LEFLEIFIARSGVGDDEMEALKAWLEDEHLSKL